MPAIYGSSFRENGRPALINPHRSLSNNSLPNRSKSKRSSSKQVSRNSSSSITTELKYSLVGKTVSPLLDFHEQKGQDHALPSMDASNSSTTSTFTSLSRSNESYTSFTSIYSGNESVLTHVSSNNSLMHDSNTIHKHNSKTSPSANRNQTWGHFVDVIKKDEDIERYSRILSKRNSSRLNLLRQSQATTYDSNRFYEKM